jgi:hypothetical protein
MQHAFARSANDTASASSLHRATAVHPFCACGTMRAHASHRFVRARPARKQASPYMKQTECLAIVRPTRIP